MAEDTTNVNPTVPVSDLAAAQAAAGVPVTAPSAIVPLPTAESVNATVDKAVAEGEAEVNKEVPVVEKSLDERVAAIEAWIAKAEGNHIFQHILRTAENWGKSLF